MTATDRYLKCSRAALVRLAGVFLGAHAAHAQVPAGDSLRAAVASEIRRVAGDDARDPAGDQRPALRALYERAGFDALWTTRGRLTEQARAVQVFLEGVASHGLRPAAYAVDTLRTLAAPLGAGVPNATQLGRYDVLMSRALLRLLAHLHSGRVNPQALGFNLPPRAGDDADRAAEVLLVSRSADVRRDIAAREPIYAQYAALLGLLERYRVLAADSALRVPRFTTRAVRPGDVYIDATALRRLLAAFGDLPAAAVHAGSDSARYTAELVDGVLAFQTRHGLEPDGVIGPATMAQLRVPVAQRVRQIELTLERWRWLPERVPERLVLVNIPEFRFRFFEHDSTARAPLLTMKVIVGQARNRRHTPVFTATMRDVVFRPYWDVPPRIARQELLPIIRRQRSYLTKERMDIVRGGERDAMFFEPTAANLAKVDAGTLRLRQRPGPDNALGLLKFDFPNRFNVYMHGTPQQQLFERARRDFSHGCIRVEDPAALGEVVLRGQEGWDRPAIEAAMQGDQTYHLSIARPVTVFVFYATAVVDSAGVAHFHEDLYGLDASLAKTLDTHQIPAPVAVTEGCPPVGG